MASKTILALVGMPGAGKSEVVNLLRQKQFSIVRLGDQTDYGLKELGLPLTEENERKYREKLREKHGMAAYALAAEEKISSLFKDNNIVVLDGLYSWEEYIYLQKRFANLLLVLICANSLIRYERLLKRKIRSIKTPLQARQRDINEIEKLNKGGPIAIADYIIENNGTSAALKQKVEALLQQLGIV